MMTRLMLIAMLVVLVGCGRASDEASVPTRAPAEVISTTTGTAQTTTAGATVIVPTLVPTRTAAPTSAPTETAAPTEVLPTATATEPPPAPTGIATVTPLPTPTTEPTATNTPEPTNTSEPTTTSTPEPTATPDPNQPLPDGFATVPWQGFIIPVPDGYENSDGEAEDSTLNDAPLVAEITVERSDADEQPERPASMVYDIVEFEDGAEAWLDVVRSANGGRRNVDDATIKEVMVAGEPGLSYAPQVPGVGDPLNYVIEIASDRLLLITIDRTYSEHQQSIVSLRYDGANVEPTATSEPAARLRGEVAYLDEGDLWLLDLAKGEPRQLTDLGTVRDFAWSPDGRRIAFATGEANDGDIWTVDVRNEKQTEIAVGDEDDGFPAYASDGTLYFVRHVVGGADTTLDIVRHASNKDTVVHSEPAGLVGATSFRFHDKDEWALGVSTGRGQYVLLGKVGEEETRDLAQTYMPESTGCAYGIAWGDNEALVLSSFDCIPHENSTISRLDLMNIGAIPATVHTGAGITSVDWASDEDGIVWSRVETGAATDGLWVIADNGEPRRVSEQGTHPRWRP